MKPYYDEDGITLYCGDVLDAGPGLEADVTITDPPYNVGIAYDGYSDRLSAVEYEVWLSKVWQLCATVGPGLVYTPGVVNVFRVPEVLATTPFHPARLLGWHRKEFAGDKWAAGPAISWEPVVWASTEDKPYFNKTFGHMGRDFLVVPSVHESRPWAKLHPCPKPVQVFQWLINLFTPEGGTVFDPFVGSGASMLAAQKMGRRIIGVEQSERYCEIAVQRLAQGVLAFDGISDEARE